MMTGLEFLREPKRTAEEVADVISNSCPPVIPANCDKVSCRECWLAWLMTGEPLGVPENSAIIPERKEASAERTPLEWERRFVSSYGVNVGGKRYSSQELVSHIGETVLIEISETVKARTESGGDIGELTLLF